jgi:putative phosphoribosyl transferase
LHLPQEIYAVVVFAHGSGSSRFSPRNKAVASALNAHRIGTLLFDLLTSDEEADRANVFNIALLADRLAHEAGADGAIHGRPDRGCVNHSACAKYRIFRRAPISTCQI